MSWPTEEGGSSRPDRDRVRIRDEATRPAGVPGLRITIGTTVLAGTPATVGTAVVAGAPPGRAMVLGIAAAAFTMIATAFAQYAQGRAGVRASEERASYVGAANHFTAATTGALEQAHALIASILRTIREVDAEAETAHESLKASSDRLASEFGGSENVPRELRDAIGHNLSSRRLLERAHRALDGAAADLAKFDMHRLQV